MFRRLIYNKKVSALKPHHRQYANRYLQCLTQFVFKMKVPSIFLFFLLLLINCVPIKNYSFRSLNEAKPENQYFILKNQNNKFSVLGKYRIDKNILINCVVFTKTPSISTIVSSNNYGNLNVENDKKTFCYKTGGLRALHDTITVKSKSEIYKFVYTE